MELRQLKTFCIVATLHSFNQAAQVLDYAQSTVSEQIKALEADLNVRLFERGGKQVALTKAGEVLLQYAQKMLDIEEEIRGEISDREEVYGSLCVKIPETVSIYYLPPILKKFHQLFPKVAFKFDNCSYFGLREELGSSLINLAFLIADTFRAADLETEKLFALPLVIVTYPDHPLTSKQSVNIYDIKKETILVPTADCHYIMVLEKILTQEKVELTTVLKFNSIEAIKNCVMAGTGITVLPEIAAKEEIAEGSLAVLPWMDGQLYANLLMIWQKNKWMPPILKAFMDTTRETLAST
jgi:DNA-binding transcriptional LysR family regulator